MTPKILKKWLDGLRSGEYMKGKGQLVIEADFSESSTAEDFDRFCCLGVLLDTCDYVLGEDYGGWDGALPPYLAEKLGITEDEQSTLATLNDSGKCTYFVHRKTGEVKDGLYLHEHPGNYQKVTAKAKTFKGVAQAIERMYV